MYYGYCNTVYDKNTLMTDTIIRVFCSNLSRINLHKACITFCGIFLAACSKFKKQVDSFFYASCKSVSFFIYKTTYAVFVLPFVI